MPVWFLYVFVCDCVCVHCAYVDMGKEMRNNNRPISCGGTHKKKTLAQKVKEVNKKATHQDRKKKLKKETENVKERRGIWW